jgi:gamma-glutamyltranspeptidase/glutathione hydrolase
MDNPVGGVQPGRLHSPRLKAVSASPHSRGLIACLALLAVAATFWPLSVVPAAPPVEKPGPRWLPGPVQASHGMVAAAHPLAAAAGVEVLRHGGNAIDALVATQMALNVVEPSSSGIGGGCFILYYDTRAGKTYCIDGREEVPAGARRADFLDRRGRVLPEPMTGGASVGVPGTVAAMWLAHERWGKLPIGRVLAPAIRLAEEGTGVTPFLRHAVAANRDRLAHFPASRQLFLHADGSVPDTGAVRKQPELARTLRLLAADGPRVFYEGELARDIVRAVHDAAFRPGKLAAEDLRAYRAVYREPVRFTYRGYEIVGMPPPTSGGITLGVMLGILEQTSFKGRPAGSVGEIDLLARAGAAAFADRNAYLGDQDWSPDLEMRGLLDQARLRARARAAFGARPGAPFPPGPRPGNGHTAPAAGGHGEGRHTTHMSIVDGDRNLVACTSTIEDWMGSGVVVPGRGFLLNNELTDFDLDREAGPNTLDPTRRPRRTALGDDGRPAGKRPRSSMTPVLVFKQGKPYLTAGSPGGPVIIGVVAQFLVNVLDYGMDVQQALDAPRVSSQNRPLVLEALYPDSVGLRRALEHGGWRLAAPPRDGPEMIGNAQAIRVRPNGTLEGGTDPRGEGAARGY